MYCEQSNSLTIYHQIRPIESKQREINERIRSLQQWLENNTDDDSIDIYFDCVEQIGDDCDLVELQQFLPDRQPTINIQDQLSDDNLIQIPTVSQPWISEIWLSTHRKTSMIRRLLNYFKRSKKQSLQNLADEFVRLYGGQFNHPIGFHFHISYAKEKWLLILKNIKHVTYSTYPYPQTRIILMRKDIPYIAR